jgi:hypothetical protein
MAALDLLLSREEIIAKYSKHQKSKPVKWNEYVFSENGNDFVVSKNKQELFRFKRDQLRDLVEDLDLIEQDNECLIRGYFFANELFHFTFRIVTQGIYDIREIGNEFLVKFKVDTIFSYFSTEYSGFKLEFRIHNNNIVDIEIEQDEWKWGTNVKPVKKLVLDLLDVKTRD